MSNDPEQIRREIERTRTELSENVNALGDKVNPGSIAKRQVSRVRGAATSVKDAVMGSPGGRGRGRPRASMTEQVIRSAANSIARNVGSQISRAILRNVLGGITRGR